MPTLKAYLEDKSIITELAETQQVAKEKVIIDNPDDQAKLEKFIEALEDCEDVGDYYSNAEW